MSATRWLAQRSTTTPHASSVRLTPLSLSRSRQLDRLESERFDVLVLGGGIYGAYTALDAASRGWRVL